MMGRRRYGRELAELQEKLPAGSFYFSGLGTPEAHVRFTARTNRGNVYGIHVGLDGFPLMVPEVFVTQMLRDCRGTPLDFCDAAMHVLDAWNGWTHICHYGWNVWHERVSLYKVFVKARLWLEIYEQHLHDGNNIEYWLAHQA